MTSSSAAASSTVGANGPICSRELAYATSPYRETRPYEGLMPTTPQNAAGQRTDPPVSLPSARSASPAATAAADPPEEPPGTRSGSWGFRVGPNSDVSVVVPIPNSSMLALPTTVAPASSSRSTTVASYGGT
jgi:hypothetical protein